MFCIFHVEEKEEFIRVIKKGLQLVKADFAINNHVVNEQRNFQNLVKAESTINKDKTKVGEVMDNDDSDKEMEAKEFSITLDNNLRILEPGIQGCSKVKEMEALSKEYTILLVGVPLGGVTSNEAGTKDRMRSRFQVTFWILFGYKGPSSQPMYFH
jgi:hypothetical protein